jgi:hypothetical protein
LACFCYNQTKAEEGDMNHKAVSVLRWIARTWSHLMAVLIIFIAIGEGIQDGFSSMLHLTIRESLLMAAFVIVTAGLILGWKWERLAGLMITLGMLAFYVLDFLFAGHFPKGGLFLIIAFPGLLYLYLSFLKPEQTQIGTS